MWNYVKGFASVLIIVLALTVLAQAQAQSDEERDFVPGEKAVFYDDYTDMVKGAAPLHWKVRGGAAKLNPSGRLTLVDRITLYPNIKALPKNFTVETDFVPKDASGGHLRWLFENLGYTHEFSNMIVAAKKMSFVTTSVHLSPDLVCSRNNFCSSGLAKSKYLPY